MIKENDILERLRSGEVISLNDPEYHEIQKTVESTLILSAQLNSASNIAEVRSLLSEITGNPIDESTTIFPPFYTNFGKFTSIGKDVFINHACSFLDMGGITIEDGALIGPRVNLVTENHPLDPDQRSALVTKPIIIKRKAWIGAGATILPGVTVGENAVVAAGAVVSKDVPDNTIVGGVPAKFIKSITLAVTTACNQPNEKKTMETQTESSIFPKGEKLENGYFTGNAFLMPLLAKDRNNDFALGSVTFEPGARTNWHTHPKGQVLIVTEGAGFYQEKGKPAQSIKKGDVVNIPENVEHWHGATANTRMVHIAISNYKGEENVTWLKPVSDEEFNEVNK